ncbi:CAP domain-containing protein [Halalkalibacter alkaliphilus]|uniref:CAP domain-containing protein n=1 Tax=Halalkalibacter alkaliphilus TaxID=2917993 RepID=A0A9X2CRP5_9BACI|nr:CAP domain-containing protein [Halalkalibacter alkaliphilus]MCL7746655.1 CAP domain-containing protein [Halalkalibacter alkaliphilus]
MKKIMVTAFLAITLVATNFSGQVDASEKVQIKTFHVNEFNQETLEKWYKEIYQFYESQFKKLEQDQNKVEHDQSVVEVQPEASTENQVVNPSTEDEQKKLTQDEQQMVDLVNQERIQRGLTPLQVNKQLTEVARVKAQDMIDHQYFSHHSPTYGSPFDMLAQFDVSYRTAGENLAGNQTVEAAHQALMNSDGHRENILNTNYGEVGIGIIEGGPYGKMFVQLFKD